MITLCSLIEGTAQLGQRSSVCCAVCNQPITGTHPDEFLKVGDRPVHDDCYYDEVGKVIDRVCSHVKDSPRVANQPSTQTSEQ